METPQRKVLEGFVVLEGIDGSGTTTQLERIGAMTGSHGIGAWTSFEPSDLPTGQFVRRVLSGEVAALPGTIARLFAADRHEHIFGANGALEHLGRGELVIFDRYFFSSLAYQGMDCGFDLPFQLNAEFPLPELLLFFDLEVDIAMERVFRRPGRDIYETHGALERVRAAYQKAIGFFEDSGMRIVRIDAASPLAEVSSRVDLEMGRIIEKKRGHG
ncbi:MAG: dTMP kinase [Treponema sp.]|nr:dTMP kinase [Treponema sp.]